MVFRVTTVLKYAFCLLVYVGKRENYGYIGKKWNGKINNFKYIG